MKKSFLSTIFFLCIAASFYITDTQAQSIHFSQFYNQPLLMNPALTGSDANIQRAGLTYRNQWASIPAPYSTLIGFYDRPILACKMKNAHLGVGAMGYHDASGDGVLKEYAGALSLAYHQTLTKSWILSVGSQLGYTHKKVDFSKLTFPAQIENFQINPDLPIGNTAISDNFGYFNTKFGLSTIFQVSSRVSWDAGVSYNYTFPPSHTFLTTEGTTNQLDGQWIFHTTGKFGVGEDISIKPLFLHMKQGPNTLNLAGAILNYHFNNNTTDGNTLNMGASYRTNDTVIFLVGADVGRISLNATYDVTVSDLDVATNNQGAVEVSLIYRMNTRDCN